MKGGRPSESYLVGRLLIALNQYFLCGANNNVDFWKSQGRCRELMEMLYEVRAVRDNKNKRRRA